MIRSKNIIAFLFFPIFAFSQLTIETEIRVKEINEYVKLIDSTSNNYKEGIIEGPIVYNSMFRRNGGWETYYLYEEKNQPYLRLKYFENQYDSNTEIDYYYQKGEMIFANLIIEYKRGKQKGLPVKKQFYFTKGKLLNVTGDKNSQIGEVYILLQQKFILESLSK